MNVTDIGHLTSDADTGEDKMKKALKREGKEPTMENMLEIATFYLERFVEDLKLVNIKLPDVMPRASENIEEDIEIIKILETKGVAYKISDGVYFDISKFPDYGKLGGFDKADFDDGRRVEINPEKRSPRDFALWKFSSDEMGWKSPWGYGFPGWHIECSAMSRKYLGLPFDVHTGGVDHIGTHHNNEIAQSESAFGKPLANYWLHNEHLNFSGAKLAKSSGDILTLKSLTDKGYPPLAFRYYLLGAHYRTPSSFSWEAMESANNSLRKLSLAISSMPSGGSESQSYLDKFAERINDDLDTPGALAVMWNLIRDDSVSPSQKRATILKFDDVLGLNLLALSEDSLKPVKASPEAERLLEERQNARDSKDWIKADELREKIRKLGYEVKDTDKGQRLEIIPPREE
jgi:cysteinyl-tRNA synthetase